MGPESVPCRVVVATHPADKKKSPVGVTRAGIVYELFFTTLPQQAVTACDVVELYLHRGAFEPQLADEDQEIDPDRWCSHSAWGQECWQVVSQWVPEPAPGTGASAGADTSAHHRVRSCHSAAERAGCHTFGILHHVRSRSWVWPSDRCHLLQNGSLHRSRLSSPARWDAPVSSRAVACCPGATPRGRWKCACRVCGQHSPLPPVSAARAVSMEWPRDREAAPGERAVASAPGWSCPAPLARLEPQRTPACLHTARATPAH